MIYFSLRWIDSESGFKSLGIVTPERMLRSYWRDMMMSISSSCFREESKPHPVHPIRLYPIA